MAYYPCRNVMAADVSALQKEHGELLRQLASRKREIALLQARADALENGFRQRCRLCGQLALHWLAEYCEERNLQPRQCWESTESDANTQYDHACSTVPSLLNNAASRGALIAGDGVADSGQRDVLERRQKSGDFFLCGTSSTGLQVADAAKAEADGASVQNDRHPLQILEEETLKTHDIDMRTTMPRQRYKSPNKDAARFDEDLAWELWRSEPGTMAGTPNSQRPLNSWQRNRYSKGYRGRRRAGSLASSELSSGSGLSAEARAAIPVATPDDEGNLRLNSERALG